MQTTSSQLLDELEAAAEDLLKYGEHEGTCTNAAQMRLLPKVDACRKHVEAMKVREARFKSALQQFKLLRNIFTIDGI